MTKRAEFRLFSNCILVKGAKRSTICDVQRNDVHFIPNFFAEKLETSIFESEIEDEGVKQCVEYLIENELGHFVVEVENFPNLNLEYEFPGYLSHAIVEISDKTTFDFLSVFSALSSAGVKFIELWIFRLVEGEGLHSILGCLQQTRIINVTIFMRFSSYWSDDKKIEEAFLKNPRISSISLYDSSKDSVENVLGRTLIHSSSSLSSKSCGKINPSSFSCNIKTFSESQKFNTCLNGKISISDIGLIKNCPSLIQSFGEISNHYDNLEKMVESTPFKRLWKVTKNEIRICRDCEFRHVCTDCRAYLEDPSNELSKPLKCGYDPYTGVWQEWSTNPLKSEAMNFYGIG